MAKDLYQEVTNKIIAAIEGAESLGSWQMPWHSVSAGWPVNGVTKKRYHGINVLLLAGAGLERALPSNEWASYKQWATIGGQVRKGEKGEMIVFYGTIEKRDDDDADSKVIPFLRCSFVFNRSQVDGLKETAPASMPNLAERLDDAERYVAATGADIRYGGGRAFYSPSTDHIAMPEFEAFKPTEGRTATEAAYGTLFHELTHWTGVEKRCNRIFGKRFGDAAYAAEEMVAEIGAAFLCAQMGIAPEFRMDHAQYVAHWLGILKSDKRAIFTASSKAMAAVEYLNALQPSADKLAEAAD